MKAKRARGVVGTLPDKEPSGFYADEAKKRQQQKQERSRARAAVRANTPIPNYKCYPFLFPNFDPRTGKGAPSPLPKCTRCRDGVIHPMEHHVCDGFKPRTSKQLRVGLVLARTFRNRARLCRCRTGFASKRPTARTLNFF
jgi:hypothetical protein